MATITEYRRFLANEPEAQIEFRTIEIFHPQLSRVYRFVKANAGVLSFVLEDTAPRNAGETVEFTAATMAIVEPSERNDSEQILSVDFGNTDGIIHEIADQITGAGFFEQVSVVYRKYYSGDLSAPAASPLYLFASNLAFDGPTSVSFTAEDTDLSSKRAGSLYTFELFPGLRE